MKRVAVALAAAVLGAVGLAEPVARPFGRLADGRETHLWRLQSPDGLVMDFSDYGGRLVRAYAPDRFGNLADVTTGFNTAAEYEKYGFCVGTLIGRFGNRIADARFRLDGREYVLALTETNGLRHCNLHGGPKGWDTKVWAPRPFAEGAVQGIAFTLVSPDGDMGFPGTVTMTVTYRVCPNNVWRIDYEATTDRPTVINPTHHSYWNLAGEASGSVLDQELTIFADRYTQTTPGLIPTVDAPVAGTGFDFTTPRRIGHWRAWMTAREDLSPMNNWYDHNFVLRGAPGALRPAARLCDRASGRTLEIFTTEPCMQMYGAQNFSAKLPTKTPGVRQVPFGAVALETQHYPDSPNRADFPTTLLRPGDTFRSTTEYRFGTEP